MWRPQTASDPPKRLRAGWVSLPGALALLLVLPRLSLAHNGLTAEAFPVKNVSIDGDLSDWPASAVRYPLLVPGQITIPEQPKAEFRAGYDSVNGSVFVGVEFFDDSDGASIAPAACLVRLDVVHELSGTRFVDFSYRDEQLHVYGDQSVVDVVRRRDDESWIYEWRIAVEQETPILEGIAIGLNVAIDRSGDELNPSWLTWGGESDYGDLLLTGEDALRGQLTGRVEWKETGEPIRHSWLQIRSLEEKRLWIGLMTDSEGRFDAALPIGDYLLIPQIAPVDEYNFFQIELESGSNLDLSLQRDPVQVTPTPIGDATVAAVGVGQRVGPWHRFTVADGLPSNAVLDLVQDDVGFLWLATAAGLSRFDGARITTYAGAEIVPEPQVHALEAGTDGGLWLATPYGVGLLEGQQVSGYATLEGLANTYVNDVVATDDFVWVATHGGVARFDGEAWSVFSRFEGLAGNRVTRISPGANFIWFASPNEPNGWVAGTGSGVSRWDGQQMDSWNREDGLPEHVLTVHEDRKGTVWVGAADSEMLALDLSGSWSPVHGSPKAVNRIYEDGNGTLWFGLGVPHMTASSGGGLVRFDGQEYIAFTTDAGLASGVVHAILEDRDGQLWVGSDRGLSRYRGERWTTFTIDDGLAGNNAKAVIHDGEEVWIATFDGGISRFDGERWASYIMKDGLASYVMNSAMRDAKGNFWFGTMFGGAARYDGKTWRNLTPADGLVDDRVNVIFEDRGGDLWFGTQGLGLSRFDGASWTTYTTQDGLVDNFVVCIIQDRDGDLWFGANSQRHTGGGISRFDGETWTNYTEEDGLGSRLVLDLEETADGSVWAATAGGLSRFRSGTWTTLTTADGLASNATISLFEDDRGHLWIGTDDGGVCRYDNQVFQTLNRHDGLASDRVWDVSQDDQGRYGFATDEGVTRYTPAPANPPHVLFAALNADQRYAEPAVVELTTPTNLVSFEFNGVSLKTRTEAMLFRYRLNGIDVDWHTTRSRRVEYADLPVGTYRFEVVAVDRDLTYSATPAIVRVVVRPPYAEIALNVGLVLAVIGFLAVSGYALKKRRDLYVEMEKELQTAHDMQVALMPTETPQIPGFEVAGHSVPANHVGGDFFQYYRLSEDRLAICLADVSGQAMEAAIPVVMFSGLLESQIQMGQSGAELFASLNRSLCRTLDRLSCVSCTMVQLDTSSGLLQLYSSGSPYPFHYQAGSDEVAPLRVAGMPFGMRGDARYSPLVTELEPGDYVVFCSDGIAESLDRDGEMYGLARTAAVIADGGRDGLGAREMVDSLIGGVADFAGSARQSDDRTVVVLKATV